MGPASAQNEYARARAYEGSFGASIEWQKEAQQRLEVVLSFRSWRIANAHDNHRNTDLRKLFVSLKNVSIYTLRANENADED